MKKNRRSDRSGRAPLRSPGRPPSAQREDRQRFWAAIATGQASEDAASMADVSPAVGTRWFREAGVCHQQSLHHRQSCLQNGTCSLRSGKRSRCCGLRGVGVREIARQLGRAASTVSRELRRNAATRSGGLEYRATTARWHADRSARRPKPAKLVVNSVLRDYVQERLAGTLGLTPKQPLPLTVGTRWYNSTLGGSHRR